MKRRVLMENLWAKEKYRVMMHSQGHYNLIRKELKQDIEMERLETLIGQALEKTPEPGAVINTFQHMWGYFKKVCSEKEKREYMRLKAKYIHNPNKPDNLFSFIRKMANKYKVKYLQNSTILYK